MYLEIIRPTLQFLFNAALAACAIIIAFGIARDLYRMALRKW